MSDRPRRSTRPPAKFQEPVPVVARPKRKAQDADPIDILRLLLKSPKSALTSIDISVRWTWLYFILKAAIVSYPIIRQQTAQRISSPFLRIS